MIAAITPSDLVNAIEPLLTRVGYVDYFAAALDYVPWQREHEGGRLWWRSILHVLVPRALYPSKPWLPSDSELTSAYTGLILAGEEQGTSISMGYMAESYVDFGIYGMFLPVLLLGLLWGRIYTFFVGRAPTPEEGFAFGTAVLIHASYFEIASVKLLGGLLMRFIVLGVLFLLLPRIRRWLEASSTAVPDLRVLVSTATVRGQSGGA
jgi:hypothetical protein